MKYTRPGDVSSPKDYLKNVRVLYDGGPESISIARLTWADKETFGFRWNISRREMKDPQKISEKVTCKGMPVSSGHPVWFVLPLNFFSGESDLSGLVDRLKKGEIFD